ncbi:MAG: 50S ribosome-binding GTPase, partial [Synechococcales cyanobacterium T60_A2020_003]|nr:50S ribosome-binding GTPase [Synechococcales cyanobacterium T60_A2020_003]
MVASASPHQSLAIDYGFLLLTHAVCADQQIHNREAKALRELAHQVQINEATIQEMDKILGQDDNQISIEKAVQNVPREQRMEVLRQVMAIAYVDGYFSPLERELITRIAQFWNISPNAIEQILEHAQGLYEEQINNSGDEDKAALSVGAKILKRAESLLSRTLITKLADIAPEGVGQRIEQLQREILLAGPEYDEAIQQCAKIAKEDFKYSNQALRMTYEILRNLGNELQQDIQKIKQTTTGQGQYQTAKDVAEQLEKTRQSLSAEILRNLESVREALKAKERALNHFSIAFMGKTKAGKSTLHAIITKEGWEAIGVGKQRTTRYNRVYEWKNIRIIDTPGIGAPGGETDEEVARSVIEEADVICYVVTDDSIQESEFAFLKVLKEKTKPLIVLLNIHQNLRDSRRLEHFLKNPDRYFALEGKSGIGGHLNRIQRYAQQHYSNDYLDLVPAMLLAAQMAQEPAHEAHSKHLFQASHIQDFLDSIRKSLIDHGAIRRSQTLLGSTVGSIDTPQRWISQQATAYKNLKNQLEEKRQSLKQQLQKAQHDNWEKLQQDIKEIFRTAFDQITPFAEEHWDAKESAMQSGWSTKLNSMYFEERLKTASENGSQSFQRDVKEMLEEIGNELKLISQLQGRSFTFTEQDSSFFDKDFVRISGMILVAAGAVLAFIFPPLGFLGLAGGAVSLLANLFKSKAQKRHEAVERISEALRQQLEQHQEKVLQQVEQNFDEYCQSVANGVETYFLELIRRIEEIAVQLKAAEGKLSTAANYLNRAYAKRIIDWASDEYEPLTDVSIGRKIRKVNRVFGQRIQIQTTMPLKLRKSQEEICKILQEKIEVQSLRVDSPPLCGVKCQD